MTVPIQDIYSLKPRAIWTALWNDNFAFRMSCAYLIFEYVRPYSIWPWLQAFPYWTRTFVILAFVAWLFDLNRKLVWTRISTEIFVLLGLILLSSAYAFWPETSWAHFMDFFNWVAVYFVLTQTVTTRQRFMVLLLLFLLASFKISFFCARSWAMRGFAFSSWGLCGPSGFLENPGELAIQMVVFAPIALFFTIGIRPHLSRLQAFFLYLMPLTAAVTVIGTNTRGGQIALASQLIAVVTMTKRRFRTLALIAVIAAVGYQMLPAEQKARFQRAGEDGTSLQRLLYWKHGWQMMKDHPILGVGYFNFEPYYNAYYPEDLLIRKEAELPHNTLIQFGTDAGFPGVAVFLVLIVRSFTCVRRVGKEAESCGDAVVSNLTKGLNLSLLGYLVAAQFVTVGYYPFFWIHLVFVTSLGTVWREEKSAERAAPLQPRSAPELMWR